MNDVLCDFIINDLLTSGRCELTPTDIGWMKETHEELQYFMFKHPDEQWCAKHVGASGPCTQDQGGAHSRMGVASHHQDTADHQS